MFLLFISCGWKWKKSPSNELIAHRCIHKWQLKFCKEETGCKTDPETGTYETLNMTKAQPEVLSSWNPTSRKNGKTFSFPAWCPNAYRVLLNKNGDVTEWLTWPCPNLVMHGFKHNIFQFQHRIYSLWTMTERHHILFIFAFYIVPTFLEKVLWKGQRRS